MNGSKLMELRKETSISSSTKDSHHQLCVCGCVCVCEREREREKEREREREREREGERVMNNPFCIQASKHYV